MHLSYCVSVPDLSAFLKHWSSKYSYPDDYKYTGNIDKPLTAKSLKELFEWKNGTGSAIAGPKLTSIMKNYSLPFSGNGQERYLNHKQPGGAIWNIFFLHCLTPGTWPIFDQHTFRAMHYMQTGHIKEIGSTDRQKYEAYESRYIPFMAEFKGSAPRTVDKALFVFGQFLKMAAVYA
jgi:hypothetical protein